MSQRRRFLQRASETDRLPRPDPPSKWHLVSMRSPLVSLVIEMDDGSRKVHVLHLVPLMRPIAGLDECQPFSNFDLPPKAPQFGIPLRHLASSLRFIRGGSLRKGHSR